MLRRGKGSRALTCIGTRGAPKTPSNNPRLRETHLFSNLESTPSVPSGSGPSFNGDKVSFDRIIEGSGSDERREREFKVSVKLASKPDIHYLKEFLSRRHSKCPQETIQILDVVLRAKPSNEYFTCSSFLAI